jgi:hypothetical protein
MNGWSKKYQAQSQKANIAVQQLFIKYSVYFRLFSGSLVGKRG